MKKEAGEHTLEKNEPIEKSRTEDMSTEDRILEAALYTVESHTISGTRMHLIAEEAQMVQSNVHYYYRTKEALLLALNKKVLDTCYNIRKEDVKKAGNCLLLQASLQLYQNITGRKGIYQKRHLKFL